MVRPEDLERLKLESLADFFELIIQKKIDDNLMGVRALTYMLSPQQYEEMETWMGIKIVSGDIPEGAEEMFQADCDYIKSIFK